MLFYASDARIWICMFMNEKLGVNRLLMRDDVPTMCESAQTIYGNASDTEHRQRQCHATVIVWEFFTGGADDMLSFTCCLCSVFLPTFTLTCIHTRTHTIFYCSVNICPWLPVATVVINKNDLSKHLPFTFLKPKRKIMNTKRKANGWKTLEWNKWDTFLRFNGNIYSN